MRLLRSADHTASRLVKSNRRVHRVRRDPNSFLLNKFCVLRDLCGYFPAGRDAARACLAVTALCLSIGCGASPITAPRIEDAIAPTFANLVSLHVNALGLPPMAPAHLEVIASCRRISAGGGAGAGEWECNLRWLGPDRQTLRDRYDVVVATDGCYTATVQGES